MNNIKLYKLLLFGFLFPTGQLNAQSDFRLGYIIENSGDTIYGKIDYRGDLLMCSICKFMDSNNIVHEYSPNDIDAYRLIDSKYYISKEIKSKKVFLEYLIKGMVNIYYMRDEKGDHYYLDKKDVRLTEIPYEEGIKYVDNNKVYYESTKHTGILNYYMQDAPELHSRIQSIKEPKHQNLIKLAEDYHNAVCDGEKCIIYEKKQPFINVNPEILGGVINFSKSYELKNEYYFHGGVIAHLWLPRVNEKIYLRTGLLYSSIHSGDATHSIYKIPLQIEYIYPKNLIRPKISFGINLYNPFHQSVGILGGCDIKLHKQAYLTINYDIDFNPTDNFPLIPKTRFTYSLLTGIKIKL